MNNWKNGKIPPREREIVIRWWKSMNLYADEIAVDGIAKASSGQKSVLKRADSFEKIILTEAFQKLWSILNIDDVEMTNNQLETYACIAGLLVCVDENDTTEFAKLAGEGESKPAVSQIRFEQLLSAKDADDLLRRTRRILKQLKNKVSIESLIEDIYLWFYQNQYKNAKSIERVPVKWAMAYYTHISKNN